MNQKLLMEEHLLITREELKRKLSIEARRIELRQEYQKYDKADLDFLIKKSPDHHNYSSNDFYNLGKWNLDNLIISHREKIFYHYDVKKKTKSIFKPSLLATYLQEKYPIVTIKPTQVNKNDPGDMWYYHPEKEMYVPNAELFFNQEIKRYGVITLTPVFLTRHIAISDMKHSLTEMILSLKNNIFQFKMESFGSLNLKVNLSLILLKTHQNYL